MTNCNVFAFCDINISNWPNTSHFGDFKLLKMTEVSRSRQTISRHMNSDLGSRENWFRQDAMFYVFSRKKSRQMKKISILVKADLEKPRYIMSFREKDVKKWKTISILAKTYLDKRLNIVSLREEDLDKWKTFLVLRLRVRIVQILKKAWNFVCAFFKKYSC